MSYTFHVGRLYVSSIREYLESCIFNGWKITYREGRGWLSKDFQISGDPSHAAQVARNIERRFLQMELECGEYEVGSSEYNGILQRINALKPQSQVSASGNPLQQPTPSPADRMWQKQDFSAQ